jgi:hypothetical protein
MRLEGGWSQSDNFITFESAVKLAIQTKQEIADAL